MELQLREEPMTALAEYATVSIAFDVRRILEVGQNGTGAFDLTERNLAVPYLKDYDAIDGQAPTRWAQNFDVANWGLISAYSGNQRLGGVVIAFDTESVQMLEDRDDLAVLWDIRVMSDFRGRGVGAALFHAAESWASKRGCREIKVETQNTNVAACRFYERQGCALRVVERCAYKEFPQEIKLLWYKRLSDAPITLP